MFQLFCWPKSSYLPIRQGQQQQTNTSKDVAADSSDSKDINNNNNVLPPPPPPFYTRVRRESCPLLQHCWMQDWSFVLQRIHNSNSISSSSSSSSSKKKHIKNKQNEVYCITQDQGRTALHMATLVSCPIIIAKTLLEANPHMVTVVDKNGMTPLHHVCLKGKRQQKKNIKRSTRYDNIDDFLLLEEEEQDQEEEEEEDLVVFLCRHLDQLPYSTTTTTISNTFRSNSRSAAPSPLFYAVKRGASLQTLRALIQTSRRHSWVAPCTGAEPYFSSSNHSGVDETTTPLMMLSMKNYQLLCPRGNNNKISHQTQQQQQQAENDDTKDDDENDNATIRSCRDDGFEYDDNLRTILRELTRRRLSLLEYEAATTKNDDNDNDQKVLTLEHVLRQNDSGTSRTSKSCFGTTNSPPQQANNNDDENDTNRSYISVRNHHNYNDLDIIEQWEMCLELLADHCPILPTVEAEAVIPTTNPAATTTTRNNNDDEIQNLADATTTAATNVIATTTATATPLTRGVVHAVVCANLWSLLPLVLWLFPEQLLQHDDRGLTPLHHAIVMFENDNDNKKENDYDDDDSDSSMLSKLLNHHHHPFNRNSYYNGNNNNGEQQQQASSSLFLAIPTKESLSPPQTPLCLALKHGRRIKNKAPFLKLLYQLMNGTSSASIPCDGLYPFALAASQDCDLTVIYTLLLASPHVLRHVVAVDDSDEE